MFRRIVALLSGRRAAAAPASRPVSGPRAFLLERLPANSVGMEIGVHEGNFSRKLLDVVQPRELHLVDPWRHESGPGYREALFGGRATGGQAEMDERYAAVCARFEAERCAGRVIIHRAASEEVLPGFPDGYFDWIYIDGNHLYSYVRRDLELSAAKVRPGGHVAGDDYGLSGWWDEGVTRAVDEVAREGLLELVEIRNRQYVFLKR